MSNDKAEMYTEPSEGFLPEARALAAQCWRDKETSGIEMDMVLAEAVARRFAGWMALARRRARNENYYRELVASIGAEFGEAARTSMDGSVQDEVVVLRVPELVHGLRVERDSLLEKLTRLRKAVDGVLEYADTHTDADTGKVPWGVLDALRQCAYAMQTEGGGE